MIVEVIAEYFQVFPLTLSYAIMIALIVIGWRALHGY